MKFQSFHHPSRPFPEASMTIYKALHEISKALLLETGKQNQELVLDRAIDFTGADRGFIVVREQGSFQEKYQVHFDRSAISSQQRKFSRTAVKNAIRSRKTQFIKDMSLESNLFDRQSVMDLGPCSALIVPLVFQDEVYAVIYMERQYGSGPFSETACRFMEEFSLLAAASFQQSLERENLARLRRIIKADQGDDFDMRGVVGSHPRMIALFETVAQVASSEVTVLIRGETGSGKEVIAELIHRNSDRRKGPLVTVHCGALPETLLEGELFGHAKGAFTGANQARSGRVAQAEGGTLFIDEVGEIPLVSQAKLLRFLQSGEFQRLGSDRVERINTRIVAATHRDLKQMISEGTFREDLYYRLNVIELEVPPLRLRKTDIPLLVAYFLEKYWRRKQETPRFEVAAMKAFEDYHYPGNVRELAHMIERVCVLARGPVLDESLLPHNLLTGKEVSAATGDVATEFSSFSNQELKQARKQATELAVAQIEAEYVQGLLKQHGGNISQAARSAGMQRSYLQRLIARNRDPVSVSKKKHRS